MIRRQRTLDDFTVSANGTINFLELTRLRSPTVVVVFIYANKVDEAWSNYLPLIEQEDRWEIDSTHPFEEKGIHESMSVDDEPALRSHVKIYGSRSSFILMMISSIFANFSRSPAIIDATLKKLCFDLIIR